MNIYTETKGFTMLISRNDSCLLIIDVQERLAPAMNAPRKVIDGCARLLKGAALLNVPAIVTEQYPKGLGPTIFDVREAAGESIFFPKTSLSAVQEDGFMQKLEALNKKQIIIAGIEEHVCVLQTAVELKEKGYDVFIVADACGSRTPESELYAEKRFQSENIVLVTVEMVFFEWLRVAGSLEFKEVQKRLIR